MKNAPTDGRTHWTASSWLPLVYEDVVRAPDTYGVVVIGNSRRDSILVTHGAIRQEVWRLLNDPRSKANDASFYRYIETMVDRRAEHLAKIALRELTRTAPFPVHWKDFPEPPPASVPSSESARTFLGP